MERGLSRANQIGDGLSRAQQLIVAALDLHLRTPAALGGDS